MATKLDLATLFPAFKSQLGASFLAPIVVAYVDGVVTFQAAAYLYTRPHDRKLFRYTVTAALALSWAHSILLIYHGYHVFVDSFSSPLAHAELTLDLTSILAVQGAVAALVQSFFAWRIGLLFDRSWLVPCLIGVLALLTLAGGIGGAIGEASIGSYLNVDKFEELRWTVSVAYAIPAATDVVISLCMYIALLRTHTRYTAGLERTYVRRIAVVIESGTLTSVLCLAAAILFAVDQAVYAFILGAVATKMYVFTLTSSLSFGASRPSTPSTSTLSRSEPSFRAAKTASVVPLRPMTPIIHIMAPAASYRTAPHRRERSDVDDVEGFAFNTTFKARRDSVAEASPGIDGDPASGWPRTL